MNNIQIHGTTDGEGAKRFSLPGITITGQCSNCNKDVELDMKYHYLMNPIYNETYRLALHCQDCDGETLFHVRLNVSLSLVE